MIKLTTARSLRLLASKIGKEVSSLRAIRSGSRVSRLARRVFEHDIVRKLFGANIALAVVVSAFNPGKVVLPGSKEEPVVAVSVIQTKTERGIQYPVGAVKLTQNYKAYHPGLDLDGTTGDPIRPIMPGKVEAISRSKFAYGNAILINHGNNITSLYAHLSKINVVAGQDVAMDTVIGQMGSTGRSTGDHLHLEVRDHGRPLNPYLVLPR